MNAEEIELPPAPSAPPQQKRRRWPWVLGVLVLIGIVATLALVATSAGQARLEAAYREARLEESAWFQLADEGRTIIADGPMVPDLESAIEFDQPLPSEQEVADAIEFFNQLERLYKAANVPSYVQNQIATTTSFAGQQAATFDGLEARWSFHPDNGLDLTIHEEE